MTILRKGYVAAMLACLMAIGLLASPVLADLCQHACIFGSDCNSRTEPCNNHEDDMDCWYCTNQQSIPLCVPTHGYVCTTTGASGGICGKMYKSTCSDGSCQDGVLVKETCERQMCTTH